MKSGEKISFEYPWTTRPDDVAIARRELEIVLSINDWDVAKAAAQLRTTPERVVAALNAPGNEALARRVAERAITQFITVLRHDWSGIEVIIRKPSKGFSLRTGVTDSGDLRVRIVRDGAEDLLQLAETIVAEAENAPGLRPTKPPRRTPEQRAEATKARQLEAAMRRVARGYLL